MGFEYAGYACGFIRCRSLACSVHFIADLYAKVPYRLKSLGKLFLQGYSVVLPEKLQTGKWNVYRSVRSPLKLVSRFPNHPEIGTLHDNFVHSVETFRDYKYLGTRVRVDGTVGEYKWMTYGEAGTARAALGSGLIYHGIPKGSSIGLYFINRPEWVITDHACSAYSYISVPLYDTLGPDAVKYIVNHAAVQAIFCVPQTLNGLLSFLSEIPTVRLIVVVGGIDEQIPSLPSTTGVKVLTYSKLLSQYLKTNAATMAFHLPLLSFTLNSRTMPGTPPNVADQEDKPHVAVLANSGLGHVIPLLEFSKRLVVSHGFRVTFLVVTTVDPNPAQDQLLNAAGLPRDLRVLGLPAVDAASVVPEDSRLLTWVCLIVEASLKSLKATLIELSYPRALVVDLFCTQALDVAGELGIPAYSFCTMSAKMLAFSLYLPTLDREVTGELVDLPGPIRVPGCPPIRPDDLLDQVKDRKNEEYRWFLYHVSRFPMAAGIFLNTWEGLESGLLRVLREDSFYRQVPAPQIHAIGPLVHEDGDAEGLRSTDIECFAWLDRQPEESVVLVSLGSGGTLATEQQVEMAWGLELSQQRFLWIVRKPTDASASAAFFNVGRDEEDDPTKYLPQGFQEKTREVGMVVSSWAAQVAILSHPSIGAFLSHCGWNSSVESLAKGVPIIAWPLYAEQRTNAAMLVEDIGVAIRPSVEEGRKVVGRKEIERVVRAVVSGEEGKRMRRRAREIRDSSIESLNQGSGMSHATLAVVCEDWKTKSRGCEEGPCADPAS